MSNALTRREEQPAEAASVDRDRGAHTYSPRFDIWENDDELILYGDLPGVTTESLDIQFEDRTLTIHGKVEFRHTGLKFRHGEYGIGDFYRTFTIGEQIDSEKIYAELNDGVLTLHLPKSEAVKPRRIEVKGS